SHAGVRIPRAGTAIVAIARHWRITGFRLIGIITVSLILGVTLVVCIVRPVATSGNRSNSDSGAKCDRDDMLFLPAVGRLLLTAICRCLQDVGHRTVPSRSSAH